MSVLPTRESLLERAAERAANEPWMLASALREMCGDGSSLDLDVVAITLGCDRYRVVGLALCRRPDARSGSFRDDVNAIAGTLQIDATRLLMLLREADSIAAFRASSGQQILAAARDAHVRDDESEPEDK